MATNLLYSFVQSILSNSIGRDLVARWIWIAFPGPSEHAVSERAGLVLGMSPKHVRRLLRKENSVNADVVIALIFIVGFEKAASMMGEYK